MWLCEGRSVEATRSCYYGGGGVLSIKICTGSQRICPWCKASGEWWVKLKRGEAKMFVSLFFFFLPFMNRCCRHWENKKKRKSKVTTERHLPTSLMMFFFFNFYFFKHLKRKLLQQQWIRVFLKKGQRASVLHRGLHSDAGVTGDDEAEELHDDTQRVRGSVTAPQHTPNWRSVTSISERRVSHNAPQSIQEHQPGLR